MPRPKSKQRDKLTHLIRVRVNAKVYERLSPLQKKSDCRSLCELSRRILSNEQIVLLHRDVSMSGVMEELALIRKEIKAIGNQQTHYFHISHSAAERAFYVKRTSELYAKIDKQVSVLLEMVHKLALVWLQK